MNDVETMKATLYTVEGGQHKVRIWPKREFGPASFTDTTLQSFTRVGGGVVLIQGSKIIALVTEG